MAGEENLGSINYNVDVNFRSLIEAGQAQDQFTQKSRESAQELTRYKHTTASVTKEYRSLKASIDPAHRAQQQFLTGAELLQKEMKSGRITMSQYAKDMSLLRKNTLGAANVGGRFKSSIGGVGSIAQQAGFQVGDFATQVAAGQSAMVAFSQQAPQFAGAFGPGGAVLGAVLAIGGAIGGAFVRGMSEGEEATKSLREQIDELNLSFEDLTDNQREALELERLRNKEDAADRIEKQREELDKLRETEENLLRLREMGSDNDDLGDVFNPEQLSSVSDRITELGGKIDTAEKKAQQADKEFEELLSGTGSRGATEEIEALNESLSFQVDVYGKSERAIALAEIAQLAKNGADAEAVAQARQLTNALYDQMDAEKARQAAAEEAEQTRQAALKETMALQRQINQLLGKADPLSNFTRDWGRVQDALARGMIDEGQAKLIMENLVDAGEAAGKESAEKFENPWQKTADSVAQSLQNAIASGDWDSLGDVIGGSIATSIAGVVNKTITESLAKDITANSSALSQVGAAFAGPIAGAVVGGAMQLALREISDYLGDDFDPTASRQASQGTGTVLGSIDAKSRSIAEATETAASAGRELVGINRDMLRALQAVQIGIAGASTRIARGADGVSINAPGVKSGSQLFDDITGGVVPILDGTLELAFDFFDSVGEIFTLGMLDLDSLLGGKSKKKDEGIQIVGGYISDLIDETLVNAYATFRVKKHAFDDYDTKERVQRIGGDVEQQFALVFEGVFDSVSLAAEELGINAARRLKDFRVDTQRISLEGLSAEEQTAELEAYFGTVFDNMAGAAVPFIEEFQQAGEGLGETLARIATQVQVTQEAVSMLGLRFGHLTGESLVEASQRLVEANGGIEQFASNMQNFTRNFASELQQFEIATGVLEDTVGTIPGTRQGFYDLIQAQDASTESGARNIANLLRVQGVADQYYDTLESAQKDYFTAEIEGQRERLSEAQKADRAVSQALDRMVYESAAVQEASRIRALNTLDRMAASGRVVAGAELDNALEAATKVEQRDFSTFADYAREFTRTTGTLGRVQDVTQTRVTNEQKMLDRLEKQLDAISGLRQDLERSQLAIIKQSSKTTKILERFELDGIEVRE